MTSFTSSQQTASSCLQRSLQVDSSSSSTLSMNSVLLACVLVSTCVVAALPQREHRKDGGWVMKTDPDRDGGRVVRGEANRQWDVTKDGKVQAEVHGHWERTYGGPNHGQRDHGVGGSIGGSWGK